MENFRIRAGGADVESNTVFGYPVHTHTYCEMTLYFPFDGSVAVNNRDICMDQITAILVKPFDFHKIEVRDDCGARFVKILFDESCLANGNVPETSFVIKIPSRSDFLTALFEEACANRGEKAYLKALINTIVCRIMMCGKRVNSAPGSGAQKLAAEAIKTVNADFCSAVTLQSVAKRLYITPQYLSQIFKAEAGIGFAEYVALLRLEKAAAMLCGTTESVTEICYMCGYKNLSHFLRSFKKKYGLSPKQYRKDMKCRREIKSADK